MLPSQIELYAGGYAPADQPGIHACTFDDATGELTMHFSFSGIANPSYVLVHPNGRWLYAVSETSQLVGCYHIRKSVPDQVLVRNSRLSIPIVSMCMSITSLTTPW